jgi:hypothetical protein
VDGASTTTPAAPTGTAPVVLAQGPRPVAATHRPVAAVAGPVTHGGHVLPFTGANLWLPFMAGALLIWTGVCLRFLRKRVLAPGAGSPDDDPQSPRPS